MASLEKMIPLSRLGISSIQYHLAEHWLTSEDMMQKIPKAMEILPAAQWWSDPANLLAGVPISEPQPDVLIYTDTSTVGWGAHVGS